MELCLSDNVFQDDDLTRHPVHPQGFLFQRVPHTRFRPETVQAMAYNYEQQLQNELEMLEREIYGDLKKEIARKIVEDEVPEPPTDRIKAPIRNVSPTRTVKPRIPEKRGYSSKQCITKAAPAKNSEPSQVYQFESTIMAIRSSKRQIQRSLVCINNSLLLGYKREPIDPTDAQRQMRRSMEFRTRVSRELYHFRRVVESAVEKQSKLLEQPRLKRFLGVYRRAARLLSEVLQHLPDYEDRDTLLATVKEILSLLILLQQDKDFTKFLVEWSRDARVIKSKEDRKVQTLNLRLKDSPALKTPFKESSTSKNVIKENRAPQNVTKEVVRQKHLSKNTIEGKQASKTTFQKGLQIDDIVDKVDKRLLNRLGPMIKQVSKFIEQQKTLDEKREENIPGWYGYSEAFKRNLESSSNLQLSSKEIQLPMANKKTKSTDTRAVTKTSIHDGRSCNGERVGKELQEEVEIHQLQQIMRRIEEMEKEENAIRRRLGGIQYEAEAASLVLSRLPQYNNSIEDTCENGEQDGRSIVVYPPGCNEYKPQSPKPEKHSIKKTKDPRVKLKMDVNQVDDIETGQLRYLKYLQLTQHLNRFPSVSVEYVQSVSENMMMSIWKEVEHEINSTLMDMANTVAHDELWSIM